MSEANVLKRLLNTSGQWRAWLFRNNTGALTDAQGRVVRFGLCRGSADAIGWTEVDIEPADVGRTVAVFTAYETKSRRGRLTPEQTNFLDAVRRSGGIAAEVREGEDINNRLRNAARDWREA